MDVETRETRLIEATHTLRWLPDPDARFRQGPRCALPEHVRDAAESYGYSDEENKHIPSPEAISRYQEALDWLRIIPLQVERDFMFYAFQFQEGEKNPIPWARVVYKAKYKKCSRQWYWMLYKSWVRTLENSTLQPPPL